MTSEYLSRQRFPGDGETTDFEVNFAGGTGDNQQGTHPYVNITDVKAYEVVPGEGTTPPETIQRDIVILGPTSFRVAPAVAAGRFLEIRRETEDRYALVDFKSLQTVSAFDLDLSNRQLLYVVQEATDGTRAVEEGVDEANAAAYSAVGTANEAKYEADRAVGIAQQAEVIATRARDTSFTLRVPEPIPALPDQEARENTLMGFDHQGVPVLVVPQSGSALELATQLADPSKGANLIGYPSPDGEDWNVADLANPDKGAAMVGRGVVAVDSIADLLDLPERARREDLRYLVKERVKGSGAGRGDFYYDPTRADENDGGIVFNGFVRIYDGPLIHEWWGGGLDGMRAALEQAYLSNEDVTVPGIHLWTSTETLNIGPPDGTYSGTVTANVTIHALAGFDDSGESAVVQFRNFQGTHVGKIVGNAFGRAAYGVSFRNSRSMTFGEIEGRRGYRWSVYNSSLEGGNNNSIKGSSLRATIGGANGTAEVSSIVNTSVVLNVGQRATVVATTPIDTTIVSISGRYYFVVTHTTSEIQVYPAVNPDDLSATELTFYSGGGFKSVGADAGVWQINHFVSQSNLGVGEHKSSAYGQNINEAVYELNSGPDIVLGRTPTSVSLKNSIVDAYFEVVGGEATPLLVRPRLFLASVTSQLTIMNSFNMHESRGGGYDATRFYVGNTTSTYWKLFTDNRILINPGPKGKEVRSGFTNALSTLTIVPGVDYMLASNPNAAYTYDLVLSVDPTNYRENWSDKSIVVDFSSMNYRSIVVRVGDGAEGLVNGQSTVRLETPGNGRLVFTKLSVGANIWHVAHSAATALITG